MPQQNPLELLTLRHVTSAPLSGGGTLLDVDLDVPQDHWILKSVYVKAAVDSGSPVDYDVVIYADAARTCRRFEHIDIEELEWVTPAPLDIPCYLPDGHAYFRLRNVGGAILSAGLIIEINLEERR